MEDYPELHVIAAGSLLEFALKNIRSFGVGRIRSMFMYPLSFDEFLLAEGKKTWEACPPALCNGCLQMTISHVPQSRKTFIRHIMMTL